MRMYRLLALAIAVSLELSGQGGAGACVGKNAALRYWSAFAQMRDTAVSAEEAKKLEAILEGTAPYSDLKYRELVERNRPAVETMLRGTEASECDWGLEYEMGSDTPIEYVRKALALGRLNVLYGFHQLQVGDRKGGMRTLTGGIRFSHDVAAGGPLVAALAAKTLLVTHLRSIDFAAAEHALSEDERKAIAAELGRIGGDGVNWEGAIQRELEVLRRPGGPAPAGIEALYRQALRDPSKLTALQKAIADAPQTIRNGMANPQKVLEQKRELDGRLEQVRRKVGPQQKSNPGQ